MWEKQNLHGWCKFEKPMQSFLQKLKREQPYYLVILVLVLHPREVKSICYSDIYTPMFIAAKKWKQSKYPFTNNGT